jgi:hypothetical protein
MEVQVASSLVPTPVLIGAKLSAWLTQPSWFETKDNPGEMSLLSRVRSELSCSFLGAENSSMAQRNIEEVMGD